MNWNWRVLMLGIASLVLSSAAAQRPVSGEKQIIALEDQWRKARVNGDTGFLERFYASDLKLQTADGKVVGRDADIALFAARDVKPEYIVYTDLRIQMFGKMAVVTGLDHLKGTYKGYPGNMWLRFTDVLALRAGRWQLVAHQSTPSKAPDGGGM